MSQFRSTLGNLINSDRVFGQLILDINQVVASGNIASAKAIALTTRRRPWRPTPQFAAPHTDRRYATANTPTKLAAKAKAAYAAARAAVIFVPSAIDARYAQSE
jgi:hypothetical protein